MSLVFNWFKTAKPGEFHIYGTASAFLRFTREKDEARKLYDLGLVDLVQRKVVNEETKESSYQYIAIKRRTPAKIPDHFTFSHAKVEI